MTSGLTPVAFACLAALPRKPSRGDVRDEGGEIHGNNRSGGQPAGR